MSQKDFLTEKINSLTIRQTNGSSKQFFQKIKTSQEEMELRKTQPIKVQHSRLKSSNLEIDYQLNKQDGGILNDYQSIGKITQNYNRLAKQNTSRKSFQAQSSFYDTSHTTRDRSGITFGTNSLGRSPFQNSTQLKFLKIDTVNSTLQQSGFISLQKSESARSQKNSPFFLNQNNQQFREDSILDGVKRKSSQSIMQSSNNTILKDILLQSQQQGVKEDFQTTQQNLSAINQGNILSFASGNNQAKLNQGSSQLINSKDIEKIHALRKEGTKMKPNENFYMQLISNDELTIPKYEKDFLSIKRERYLENLKGDKIPFPSSSSILKPLPNLNLEDGSILEVEKVKNITNNLQKTHRLTHHNSQNNGFRKPDERKDAKILSEWLDEMINKVYNEQITSYYDFYEKFELIFDGIISEISRQLQTDCSERAQLLRKVWNIYSNIIGEFFQKTQKTNIKIESENFKRVNNVHKMYLNDILSQNELIKELFEKLDTKENYMNKLRSENRYLRKKWKKLEKGNQFLMQDLEQQLQMYEESVKENNILKMKIEGILMTQQNEFSDQFNRNDIQDRFNDEVEKVRNKLFEYFSQLYDEQRSKLQEAYQVRENLKEKEILLAQKIEDEDAEYEKNRLNNPRIDQDGFDDNILDNKCIDTSDLFQTNSIAIDTSTLISYATVETQATPETVKQVSRQVQATVKMQSQDIQADLRSIQQENKSLTADQHMEIRLINENFSGYINQQYTLKLTGLENVKSTDLFDQDFRNFKHSIGDILQKIQLKEEFSYNDTTSIVNYIDLNLNQVLQYINKLFGSNQNQTISIGNLRINLMENKMEILLNTNRVILYHLYLQQIQSGGVLEFNLDAIKDDLATIKNKSNKPSSSTSLDQQQMAATGNNAPDLSQLGKSSFYQDKLKRASKAVMVGVQFYKEAQIKKGQNQEEKIDSYHKYQALAEEFEHRNEVKSHSQEQFKESSINKFKFSDNEISNLEEEQIKQPSIPQIKESQQKISSLRKVTNSSISENSGEDNQSDSKSSLQNQSNNERESNSDSRSEKTNSKESSRIILSEQYIIEEKRVSSNKNISKNDQEFFKFIQNEENSNGENDQSNSLSLNISSPQKLKKDSLQLSPLKLQNRKSDLSESQFSDLSASKQLTRIREDSDVQMRRRSSVMSQLVDNARVSFTIDNKTNPNSQPTQYPLQIPLKLQGLISSEEEAGSRQSSPKNSSLNNSVYSQNQEGGNFNKKCSTQMLLRELKIITPVDNIFNRLRVSKNSNKVTREATQIIEKAIGKIKNNKEVKIDQKDQKISIVLKTFGNIMVDLMKFVKKNTNLNFPHFHSFSFDYFINNFGYSQSTEKKFQNMVQSCFQLKSQHTRINMYYKLLVGEVDYIDYKFLLEIIQKIDDTNQNGIGVVSNSNEKSFIGWSKVYEFFMAYFGQVISLKSYQMYERQLQLMKNKTFQSNKVMVNTDDAIELIMNIYQSEMKQKFCLNYFDLFSIVDIYDCNFLTLDQFFLLYYSIEPENEQLNKSQLTQIFMQEHDLQLSIADSTKLQGIFDESIALLQQFTHIQLLEYGIQKDFIYGLSIYRFCQICIDYEFLSLTKQSKFLEYSLDAQLQQLKLDFNNKIDQIKKRLAVCGKYNIQHHLQIKALKKYLDLEQDISDKFNHLFSDKRLENAKQVMLTYKLLESISKQLYIQYFIEKEMLTPSLKLLQSAFQITNQKFKNKKIRSQ